MTKHTVAMKYFSYMMSDVFKERKKHMLASLHFNRRGDVFFLFSAIITLLQAFLASLAQAESNGQQRSFNVTIAFLAAFSVFWQSLLKNWNYKGRAALHDSAASTLSMIYKKTKMKVRQFKANEDESTDDEDENEVNETNTLHSSLAAQFEQATEGCTSLIPAKISAAFDLLDNRIEVCKRNTYKTGTDKGTDEENANKVQVKWGSVYTSLYRELSAVIIRKRSWPFFLPDPESVVNETIDIYKKESKANENLLKTVLDRNIEINNQYSGFDPFSTPSADSNTAKASYADGEN